MVTVVVACSSIRAGGNFNSSLVLKDVSWKFNYLLFESKGITSDKLNLEG
jgi:hypothetical protein